MRSRGTEQRTEAGLADARPCLSTLEEEYDMGGWTPCTKPEGGEPAPINTAGMRGQESKPARNKKA